MHKQKNNKNKKDTKQKTKIYLQIKSKQMFTVG